MGAAYTVVGKAVGTQDLAFQSMSGFLIAGLRVDNESGSWITVEYSSYRLFVPPYTIGWLTPIFPKSQSGPNVYYSPGPDPTLYPSTTAGRPAIVTVYEDIVPPSPGVSYLNPFGGIPGPSLGSSCDDPLYVYVCNSEPPGGTVLPGALLMGSTFGTTIPSGMQLEPDFVVSRDTDGYVDLGPPPQLVIPSADLEGVYIGTVSVVMECFGQPTSGYAQVVYVQAGFPTYDNIPYTDFFDNGSGTWIARVDRSPSTPAISGDIFSLSIYNGLDVDINIPSDQYGVQLGMWRVNTLS